MKVHHSSRKRHSLFVAPAADPRSQAGSIDADWLEPDGSAKSILVNFDEHGTAIVPSSLGRYLVATRQATSLFLPRFMAA